MMSPQGCAKGPWQMGKVRSMLCEEGASSATYELRGRAANYSGRYQASMSALIGRLTAAGYAIYRRSGKLGGEWSARYWIVWDVSAALREPPEDAVRLSAYSTRLVDDYGQDEADGAACRAMATALAAIRKDR